MRDITARSRWLFWTFAAAILLLSALPSMILIEKLESYRRFLSGWNPGTLRQLTVSYVPHRSREDVPESPDIRYVEFRLAAPRAKSVQISGSFNQWQPLPLKRDKSGAWKILLPLPKGAYCYAFDVDGARALDPKAAQRSRSAAGECSMRKIP